MNPFLLNVLVAVATAIVTAILDHNCDGNKKD